MTAWKRSLSFDPSFPARRHTLHPINTLHDKNTTDRFEAPIPSTAWATDVVLSPLVATNVVPPSLLPCKVSFHIGLSALVPALHLRAFPFCFLAHLHARRPIFVHIPAHKLLHPPAPIPSPLLFAFPASREPVHVCTVSRRDELRDLYSSTDLGSQVGSVVPSLPRVFGWTLDGHAHISHDRKASLIG